MHKRIRDITIILQNHWGRVLLYTQLEEKKNGKIKLDIYEPHKIHKIDIPDESDFIMSMESTGITEADNMCFMGNEDRDYEWVLRIAYDEKEIVSYGSNAIPGSFIRLMRLLGCEMGSYEQDITSGVAMQGSDRVNLLCGVRGRNRVLTELWDEEERCRNKYRYREGHNGRYKMSRPEGDTKSCRVKYEVIIPGTDTRVNVWEEEHRLHYSWYYPFWNRMNLNQVDDGISEVAIEELDQKIDELGGEQTIKAGNSVLDPASFRLEVIDRNGKMISYHWSDDDHVSEGLTGFVRYLGIVIGDAPFTL